METVVKIKVFGRKVIELILSNIDKLPGHFLHHGETILPDCDVNEHRRLVEENTVLHQQLDHLRHSKEPNNSKTSAKYDGSSYDTSQEIDENLALREEINNYRSTHAELLEKYEKLIGEMKKKKIDSFEALAGQDKELMVALVELIKLTEPMPMEGFNVGVFGMTSAGKSTLLNSILGSPMAKTGVGETTTRIESYPANGYVLWDVPGRNDEVSYFTMQYISFFKGLSKRIILIQSTIKENSSFIKLLDAVELRYTIVVNKFDRIDDDEREAFQKQIHAEINELDVRGVENLYFVSAKKPNMFSDWMRMLTNLKNPS